MLKSPSMFGSRAGAAVLFLMFSSAVVAAQDRANEEANTPSRTSSLLDAFTKGDVTANFRYRFEYVDQDGFGKEAYASTLRTALGYRTGEFAGFQGYVEFEDVSNLGADDLHNNLGFGHYANGVTKRPVIADPEGTSLHQAYIDYALGETMVRYGDQEIALDDERFVGPVGWRQHHQTFDAALLQTKDLENTTISLAYVSKVKQITRRVLDTDTLILNGNYAIEGVGQVTAYDYYIDMTKTAFFGLSTNTVGVELKGRRDINEHVGYRYEAEYAYQSDVADNPGRVSAHYYHLMVGSICEDGYGLRVGYEVLGGTPGYGAFQTPLATLHAWNGWADKFLATPATGLRDLYVKAEGPVGPGDWAVIYHNFAADAGGATYGNELDAVLGFKAPWGQTIHAKLAYYDAGRFSRDTTKVWIYSGFKF